MVALRAAVVVGVPEMRTATACPTARKRARAWIPIIPIPTVMASPTASTTPTATEYQTGSKAGLLLAEDVTDRVATLVAAADDQGSAETCSTAAGHSLLPRKRFSTPASQACQHAAPCGLHFSASRLGSIGKLGIEGFPGCSSWLA